MIKSLELINVMSHQNSVLEFSPFVNMIIGKSGKGKSALIHGLTWPITNRPLGDDLMAWDCDSSSSTVILDDSTISIQRNNSNFYIINDDDDHPLKGFGAQLPEEVSTIFNIDQKTNIQRQLEESPIFLLSESPGEVAKFFNRVAGLDLIDRTIANGKTDIRRTSNHQLNKAQQIKQKQQELEKYEWVDRLYPKVIKACKIEQKTNENRQLIKKTKTSLEVMEKRIEQIEKMKSFLSVKPKLKKAHKLVKSLNDQKEGLKKIKKLSNSVSQLQKEIDQLGSVLDIKFVVKRTRSVYDKLHQSKKKKRYFLDQTNIINKTINKITELQTEKEIIMDKLKDQMPDICPLCGK